MTLDIRPAPPRKLIDITNMDSPLGSEYMAAHAAIVRLCPTPCELIGRRLKAPAPTVRRQRIHRWSRFRWLCIRAEFYFGMFLLWLGKDRSK